MHATRAIVANDEATTSASVTKKSKKPREPREADREEKSVDPATLNTLAQAELTQVWIRAQPSTRQCVFGIYDCVLSRFNLSEDHLRCLYMVGRARRKGILQSEGAKELKIANKNFFYVVKNLEERRLIVRTSAMVQNGPNKQTSLTSLLHLPRFAPEIKLTSNQYLKMVETDRGIVLDPSLLAEEVCDDNKDLRAICDKISKAKDRIVIESELKQVMDFRGTKGHRAWRKHRQRLEQSGCIESFAANVREDRGPVACIRLIKHWSQVQAQAGADKKRKGPAADSQPEAASEDDEDSEDPMADEGVLMEVSMERQAVELIARAGPEGITRVQLTKALGVDSKRLERMSAEMVKRHCLGFKIVSAGRIINSVLTAPPSLQALFQGGGSQLALEANPSPLLALTLPDPAQDLGGAGTSEGGGDLSEGGGGGRPLHPPQVPPISISSPNGVSDKKTKAATGASKEKSSAPRGKKARSLARGTLAQGVPGGGGGGDDPMAIDTVFLLGPNASSSSLLADLNPQETAKEPQPPSLDTSKALSTKIDGSKQLKRIQLTENAMKRAQVFLSRLQTHRWILRQEARHLLEGEEGDHGHEDEDEDEGEEGEGHEGEQEAGASNNAASQARKQAKVFVSSRPDRKTITRTFKLLETHGKVKPLLVTLPPSSRYSKLNSLKQHEVYLRPDVTPTPEVIKEIIAYIEEYDSKSR